MVEMVVKMVVEMVVEMVAAAAAAMRTAVTMEMVARRKRAKIMVEVAARRQNFTSTR